MADKERYIHNCIVLMSPGEDLGSQVEKGMWRTLFYSLLNTECKQPTIGDPDVIHFPKYVYFQYSIMSRIRFATFIFSTWDSRTSPGGINIIQLFIYPVISTTLCKLIKFKIKRFNIYNSYILPHLLHVTKNVDQRYFPAICFDVIHCNKTYVQFF